MCRASGRDCGRWRRRRRSNGCAALRAARESVNVVPTLHTQAVACRSLGNDPTYNRRRSDEAPRKPAKEPCVEGQADRHGTVRQRSDIAAWRVIIDRCRAARLFTCPRPPPGHRHPYLKRARPILHVGRFWVIGKIETEGAAARLAVNTAPRPSRTKLAAVPL